MTNVDCCIVGGGPAGAVLSYLLARAGVRVLLLESQPDFDRAFRGDTVHPSSMEVFERLGLAEAILARPHRKMRDVTVQTPNGPARTVDLSLLADRTRYPFVTLLPQAELLSLLTSEAARRYPGFELRMRASVRDLVREDGRVVGVRYETDGASHEVRARLVVGADGRSSGVRKAAGIELKKSYTPMDVLWIDLPKVDPEAALPGLMGTAKDGHIAVRFDRGEHWQVGYVILKGSYRALREEGVEGLRSRLAEMDPAIADALASLTDLKQVALLTVAAGRVERWYAPGLLLIGDAAHVMSPVGGVGINYAIQDAVAAANLLWRPLVSGRRITTAHLRAVERRRLWPTRVVQAFQSIAQRTVVERALDTSGTFKLPLPLRFRCVRRRLSRFIAYGVRPERVRSPEAPQVRR